MLARRPLGGRAQSQPCLSWLFICLGWPDTSAPWCSTVATLHTECYSTYSYGATILEEQSSGMCLCTTVAEREVQTVCLASPVSAWRVALKNCVTFVFGVFCPECWALVTSQWPCEIWQPQESEQYKTQTHPNTQVKHIDANNYMELMMERDLQYSDSLDVMLMFSFDENLNTCWCWCTVAVQILTFGEETSKCARLAFAGCQCTSSNVA